MIVVLEGVTIVDVKRMRSTESGNPRFQIMLDGGRMYPTKCDAQCNYVADAYAPACGVRAVVDLTLEDGKVMGISGPTPVDVLNRQRLEAGA